MRNQIKYTLVFLAIGPLIGNLILALGIPTFAVLTGNEPFNSGVFGSILIISFLGLFWAHALAGVPAALTGLVVSVLSSSKQSEYFIAGLAGFCSTAVWASAVYKMSYEQGALFGLVGAAAGIITIRVCASFAMTRVWGGR